MGYSTKGGTFSEMRSTPGGQDVDEYGAVRAFPLLSGLIEVLKKHK